MLEPTRTRLADVLFVEDSYGDVVLTKAILKTSRIFLNLHVARDAEEALEFVRSTIEEDMGFVDLILLDFNLPKKSGMEMLSELKANPATRDIPVVMLSGSDEPNDIKTASELGAHGYIVKPLQEEALKQAVLTIPSLDFSVEADEKRLLARSI